ncbi:redoxin family protein [Alteromonas oceanisediminis]|uniref:redoxin family protein n=1 Tax=Alteromonas oceanisediminis TaxID=2836180 RepID=UPI001BD95EE8|nr:redoxin family protein [Alteromonas oceanisediminis]MBT0585071.1 redoxin family protein [Alteromonas oceanisediminis]
MNKSLWFAVPAVIFTLLVVFLFQGLFGDPRERDSMVQGQPLPPFSLPDLMDWETYYTEQSLLGEVTILNVWGVWCVTCAVELPYLTQLREQQGVRFVGLYYDQDLDPDFGTKTLERVRGEVSQMLRRLGDPYQFQIFDVVRDYSLDLGVTGAPEHFVIDKRGHIRMHHVGDINERVWKHKIKPLYEQLLNEPKLAVQP